MIRLVRYSPFPIIKGGFLWLPYVEEQQWKSIRRDQMRPFNEEIEFKYSTAGANPVDSFNRDLLRDKLWDKVDDLGVEVGAWVLEEQEVTLLEGGQRGLEIWLRKLETETLLDST